MKCWWVDVVFVGRWVGEGEEQVKWGGGLGGGRRSEVSY